MSSKRLDKTVIEGGRIKSNKWDRRYSSKNERIKNKQYLHEVVRDLEHAEEIMEPERKKVYKEFSDKLSPMYRWIESQLGRPWKEVHSEIFKKFNSDTTAGRHILFDHLLESIVDTQSGYNKYGYLVDPDKETLKKRRLYRGTQNYFVNEEGFLCKVAIDKKKFYREMYEKVSEEEYIEIGNWLNGRMILNKDNQLYWCCPNDGLWMCSWIPLNQTHDAFTKFKLKYYLFDNGMFVINPNVELYLVNEALNWSGKSHGDHWEFIENPFSFRQRGLLSEEEIKFFNSLKNRIKDEILSFTKGWN